MFPYEEVGDLTIIPADAACRNAARWVTAWSPGYKAPLPPPTNLVTYQHERAKDPPAGARGAARSGATLGRLRWTRAEGVSVSVCDKIGVAAGRPELASAPAADPSRAPVPSRQGPKDSG